MSRIGKMPVKVPAGVTVTVAGDNTVTVKGPKGTLTQKFAPAMTIAQADGEVTVSRPNDEKENRALHGLTRALIFNMVTGVTTGYERALELVGTGYRAQKQGNKVTLQIGFSHPVEIPEQAGITLEVPAQNQIVVKGIDKQQVGEIAACIRRIRPPEPYHGKGIRYKDEVVRLKAGKAGGKGGKK
nr:50S ribosomal protein L6 [bacterium]